MPRFVPIIIQVKGGDDAQAVARKVVNAFKEIDRSADSSAKSTDQSSKKTSNAFKQIENEAERSAKAANNSFSKYLSAEFFGGLARQAFSAVFQYSKQFVSDSVRLAQELQNALLGISSIAAFKGIDAQQAQEAVRNLRLVRAGIITIADASIGLKNLLQSGFGLEQATTLLERFSDTAAFGKQAALSYGEAIRSATEGIKNQNSILVDNAGITKNIEVILRERGHTIQDLSDKVKGASAREALYAGLIAESAAQVGDADKLTRNYTGALAAEETAYQNVERAIGGVIIKNAAWVESTRIVAEQLNNQAEALSNSDSETAKFANHILDYAASIKAQLIPFAAFMTHLFLGIGHSLNAATATVLGNVQSLIDSVLNAVTGAVEKSINLVINGLNGANAIWRRLGVPTEDIAEVRLQRFTQGSKVLQFRDAESAAASRDFDAAERLSAEGKNIRNRLADARWMQEFNRSLGLEKEKRDALSRAMEKNSQAAQDLTGNMKEAGKATKDTFKVSGQLPVPMSGVGAIDSKIREVAAKYGIDERLAFAQIFQESRFKPGAVSPKGARGLGQIMPGTGAQYGLGRSHAFDVGANLEAYGAIMRDLLARYGGNVDLALIAYNWGQGNADKVLANLQAGRGVRLPKETRGYVAEIGKFGPFGKEVPAPSDNPFFGKTPQEMAAMLRATDARQPLATTDIETAGLPRDVLRPWEMYYDQLEQRESDLADRRKFFADEYLAGQRELTVDLGNVELDLAKFRQQQADDQFVEQGRLLSARSEELGLLQDIARAQDDLANGPYNESLRIELAYLQDIADIRRRDEEAIKAQNRAQLELADGAIVHGERVRAAVLEHLASQRSMTEAWADGIIGAYDKILGYLDRGIEKLTHGIPIITQLVIALIHQLANRLFQRFLDMFFPSSGGATQGLTVGQKQSGGIWGTIQSVLSGGRGGTTGTPPFAGFNAAGGTSGAAGVGLSGLAALLGGGGGGGITAPTSLTTQITNQNAIASAVHEAGHTAAAGAAGTAGFSLAGLAAGLGPMAVVAGVQLELQLLGAALQGKVSPLQGALGGGLLGLVFAFIGQSKVRRKNETDRAALNSDTYSQVIKVLNDARAGRYDSPASAIAAFEQIKASYFQRISGYDSKTKRIATDVWNDTKNGFEYYRPLILEAANKALKAREVEKHLVPEFATGGTVPYRTSLFSMATGLTPIKVSPGEAMFAPGSSFGTIVPGEYRGYDSVVTAARPGTRIVPRAQVRGARGFAGGGVVGSDGGAPPVIGELNVHMQLRVGKKDASEIVVTGVETREGGNAVVQRVNVFLEEGN